MVGAQGTFKKSENRGFRPEQSTTVDTAGGITISNPASSQRMQYHTFVADGVAQRNHLGARGGRSWRTAPARLGDIDLPKLTEDPEGWDGHELCEWDPQVGSSPRQALTSLSCHAVYRTVCSFAPHSSSP
jgi:hypothetical protein